MKKRNLKTKIEFFVKETNQPECKFGFKKPDDFQVYAKVGDIEELIESFKNRDDAHQFAKKFNSEKFRDALKKEYSQLDKVFAQIASAERDYCKALKLSNELARSPARRYIYFQHKFLKHIMKQKKPFPKKKKRIFCRTSAMDTFVKKIKGTPFSLRKVEEINTRVCVCDLHGTHSVQEAPEVSYYLTYDPLNMHLHINERFDSENKAEAKAHSLVSKKNINSYKSLAKKTLEAERKLTEKWNKKTKLYDVVDKIERRVPRQKVNFFREYWKDL